MTKHPAALFHIETTTDIVACRALRRTVFIEEQGVSEADEVDGLDREAVHLLATFGGAPVGSARLLTRAPYGKIGRVCVLAGHRGHGFGSALTRAAVAHFATQTGLTHAKLGAQVHAIPFYERLGFAAQGPVYDDAGIAHRDMTCAL